MGPSVKNKNLYYYVEDPANDVYIGRPSKWGNPFEIGKDGTRKQVIEKYKTYFFNNPQLMADARKELEGKNLVCFCMPEACHGDVLLEFVNSADLSV